MIQFDRIEDDRMYLGFKRAELDEILLVLEKQLPDEKVTNRLDALAMFFAKEQNKGGENETG